MFQNRVAETESSRKRLMSHLSRNMDEIYQQEHHINQLQNAVANLGPPLKVTLLVYMRAVRVDGPCSAEVACRQVVLVNVLLEGNYDNSLVYLNSKFTCNYNIDLMAE